MLRGKWVVVCSFGAETDQTPRKAAEDHARELNRIGMQCGPHKIQRVNKHGELIGFPLEVKS